LLTCWLCSTLPGFLACSFLVQSALRTSVAPACWQSGSVSSKWDSATDDVSEAYGADAKRPDRTGLRGVAADRAEKGQPKVIKPRPPARVGAAPGFVAAAAGPTTNVDVGNSAEWAQPAAAVAPPPVEAAQRQKAAAARVRSKGPSHMASAPHFPSPRTVGASGSTCERQPLSMRAWFWNGDNWVAARVLRTNGDGSATVRLSGGSIVRTPQSMLQPRLAQVSKEPVPPPPPVTKKQRTQQGASHQQRCQEKRPSAEAESHANAHVAPELRLSSPCTMPSEDCVDNEDARWAAARMVRLRNELHGLDSCSKAERRAHLRRLQLELHPDKQPPERRERAQRLFHLVQREWERWEEADSAARCLAGG